MKKNYLLLCLDFAMFAQFLLVIFTGLVEHHPGPTVHAALATLLLACSLGHVLLHQKWVSNAVTRYGRLPREARANAQIDLFLLVGYAACGVTGWIATLLPFHLCLPPHWLASGLVISVQTLHLARHWKWAWTTVRRGIFSRAAG
jgi:hypothetical protein